MRYFNGLVGVALLVLVMIHLGSEDWALWSPIYAVGALVALMSLKPQMSLWMAWSGAIIATATMFVYFAFFFQMVPHLRGDWVAQGHECIYLFIAAFCMIPVLSDFSCRLKGEECELSKARAKKSLHAVLRRVQEARQPSH